MAKAIALIVLLLVIGQVLGVAEGTDEGIDEIKRMRTLVEIVAMRDYSPVGRNRKREPPPMSIAKLGGGNRRAMNEHHCHKGI